MQTVPLYVTRHGAAIVGDARVLLRELGDETVDLVITSPPFASVGGVNGLPIGRAPVAVDRSAPWCSVAPKTGSRVGACSIN